MIIIIIKNNPAFCLFSQNFGPFYAGSNSATFQKLTPLMAGVIKADKVLRKTDSKFAGKVNFLERKFEEIN